MPGHRHELSWQWQHRRGPQSRLATLDDEIAAGHDRRPGRDVAGVLAVARQLPAPAAPTAGGGCACRGHRARGQRRAGRAVLPALRTSPGCRSRSSRDLADYRSRPPPHQRSSLGRRPRPISRDWFELGVTVHVDGVPVPFVQLFAALAAGEQLFVLPDGTYFPLDTAEFARLRDADRRGPGSSGQARQSADQPVPGRSVGRAGRRRRAGPAVGRLVRAAPQVPRTRPRPAPARRSRRDPSPVPAGRVPLAGHAATQRPRRRAGRRHGPREDGPGARDDRRGPRRRPVRPAVPGGGADQRRRATGRRSRPGSPPACAPSW